MSPLARARRRRRPRGRSAVVRDARALARIVVVTRLGVAHRLGHVDLVRLAADGVRVAGALLVAEVGVGWVVAVLLVAGRLLEVVLGDLESLLEPLAALGQRALRFARAEVLLVVVLGAAAADAGSLTPGRLLLAAQQVVLRGAEIGVHAGPAMLAVFLVLRHCADATRASRPGIKRQIAAVHEQVELAQLEAALDRLAELLGDAL